ncbi:iron-containing alcohol dehydrogenase [Tessaracoccus antarcticus]|uniref:Iron-containing alcohol dehydrogenase n=1 Tax=Tessaracoccus antarcticus TaxID=2479848 RepID=A0A3M0GH47_9ACTN|nr:iron-containing alcohol dehydrogenase [Tessaracoccus antarcticus]RMB62052.1 iron-containing alcohol dehydrogenase [Tessaracoccus antarcticus]
MNAFTFATATTIAFGAGVVAQLDAHSRRLGGRAFLITGGSPDRTAQFTASLPVVGTYALPGEPTFEDARDAVAAARAAGADNVIGIGGGAVLDLAKAVAILVLSDADPMEHAEVIGAGRPLPGRALPFIAVPTTAGTGSEVTANAVLTSVEHRVKVSLRSPAMLADVALVDPQLALSCPPLVTAHSGMDAITQCLEPLTSRFANPMVDALSTAGLRAGGRAMVRAVENGDDLEARTDMALCSLMGGLSLANAKLGAVHGLAGVLGGVTGAPHGAICAALLRSTTAANIAALQERDPRNPALDAYARAAEALTGEPGLPALDAWLRAVQNRLGIAGLAALGVRAEDHGGVVDVAMQSSSMQGNPVDLSADELLHVLQMSS